MSHTSQVFSLASCQAARRFDRPVIMLLLVSMWLILDIGTVRVVAQERYLVGTEDGLVTLYDLATNMSLESVKADSWANSVAAVNQRLAFALTFQGISMFDLTIGREANKIPGVSALYGCMTSDGKYLLAVDLNRYLRVMDSATFTIVKQIDLWPAFGGRFNVGGVVAVPGKAYVLEWGTARLVAIDLNSYSVSNVPLPAGSSFRRVLGITPDSSTLVTVLRESSDGHYHVVLLSTATDQVISNNVQMSMNLPWGLVVTPYALDPSRLFAYAAFFTSGQYSVAAIDLRPNSASYGNVLMGTAVGLGDDYFTPNSMAINSDGSRVLVGGVGSVPSRNVEVVDTWKMFNDPTRALIAQVQVNNGVNTRSICTGFFSTTPPNTAPTVSSVSGDITNDAAHEITITGGNFQPGALVRIGSMTSLAANVLGSSTLTVTVPANAPSGRYQDIVVTNPLIQAPPDQQNQSGLLPGQFSIVPNPRFQPTTQFATTNRDFSFSVYDLGLQTLVNVQTLPTNGSYNYWPAFNVDGKEMYLAGYQARGSDPSTLLQVDAKTRLPGTLIGFTGYTVGGSQQTVGASRDPQSGKPVIYVPWSEGTDLHVSVVDSDSNSPTFNQVVNVFDAGINDVYQGLYLYAIAFSPGGTYAYLWYERYDTSDLWALGIMDLTRHGSFASIPASTLGAYDYQSQIGISPDGKNMLLAAQSGARTRIRVFDLSIPMNPKLAGVITPAPIPRHGLPQVFNYQIVGDQLYAIDDSTVSVFNFRPGTHDFRQRGYSVLPNNIDAASFSSDGAYMYVTDRDNDAVAVFDVSKLATGKDVLLTNIRAPYGPWGLDVSPVPPPAKSLSRRQQQVGRGQQERVPVPGRERSPARQ